MAFFAKNPDKIIQEALDFMKLNTAITSTGPGSKFRSLLEAMKLQLDEAYKTFDYNVAVSLIHGATGRYLDFIGDMFGLSRMGALRAGSSSQAENVVFYVQEGTFGDINNGQDITVPSGTQLWAIRDGKKITYRVSAGLTLSRTLSETAVSVEAEQAGLDGNSAAGTIIYHGFKDYALARNGLLMVRNTASVETGRDTESDENFRYRIINQKLSSQAANETAIRMAALEVPGVADIVIFPRHYGVGTAFMMIKATTPTVSDELVNAVNSRVQMVKAAGIKLVVGKPKETLMSFVVTLNLHDNSTSSDRLNAAMQVKSVITDYVNNLDIGETFDINALAALVTACHPKIKSIGKTNRFFDYVYIHRPVIDKYIKQEITGDYTPQAYEKLITSSQEGAIDIK